MRSLLVVGVVMFLARFSLPRGFSATSFVRAVFAVAFPAVVLTWCLDALPAEYQPDLYARAIYASLAAVVTFIFLVQMTKKENGIAATER